MEEWASVDAVRSDMTAETTTHPFDVFLQPGPSLQDLPLQCDRARINKLIPTSTRRKYGDKFVRKLNKRIAPSLPLVLPPTAAKLVPVDQKILLPRQLPPPSLPPNILITLSRGHLSKSRPTVSRSWNIIVKVQILRLPKLHYQSVEPAMNLFEADLSPHKTASCLVDIINVVSVARHVKNRLKLQVSTSFRTDRIVNNIITSSIIPCVRNAARVSRATVFNSRMLQSAIPTALLVTYSPLSSDLLTFRLVMFNLTKTITSQMVCHTATATLECYERQIKEWRREKQESS